jgi:hypothetical protein
MRTTFTVPSQLAHRVLVLECVKELGDAYSTLEILEHHSLPLLEVRPLFSKHDQQGPSGQLCSAGYDKSHIANIAVTIACKAAALVMSG